MKILKKDEDFFFNLFYESTLQNLIAILIMNAILINSTVFLCYKIMFFKQKVLMKIYTLPHLLCKMLYFMITVLFDI